MLGNRDSLTPPEPKQPEVSTKKPLWIAPTWQCFRKGEIMPTPTKKTTPPKRKPAVLRKEERQRRKTARSRFEVAKSAHKDYARSLNQVAKQIASILEGLAPEGVTDDYYRIHRALASYAELIQPWATSVAEKMLRDADQRSQKAWASLSGEIGINLREEITGAPIGDTYAAMLKEQVDLITSLPLEAAQRVQELSTEALMGGKRPDEVAEAIRATGKVTASRAMTIARTETSRAAMSLTQARALHVGSAGYIWRTAGDRDVRSSHAHLEGKFIPWDTPPVSGSNGERAHAGCIYNCRCFPEPILDDIIT
jgi:SPP1 gp7 family putative phage head morphogenesis protein